MSSLTGKRILVGVSGSIAAYKAAFLVRLLVKEGAEVQVLMTPAATRFISSLTLSTLSKRPVFSQVSSDEGWNNHVELGIWADAYLIAPATANTLAHFAQGLCDNMVSAVYLSARCPVFLAPAMDMDMWHHPATRANVDRLAGYGNHMIEVGHGELASGLIGAGRLAEPEEMVAHLKSFFDPQLPLKGKRVLLTAGPTHEAIDPVRFIGNRSSGKMGVALAWEAQRLGAEVDLVLGPSAENIEHTRIQLHRVESAQEMWEKATALFSHADIGILAAAVADYRPEKSVTQKIKSKEGEMLLRLVKNPDIAATLGSVKKKDQLLVGFALETHDAIQHATSKLEKKNLDLIVLNSLEDPGAGFGHDTNKITLLSPEGMVRHFELKTKVEVAKDIFQAILDTIILKNKE